VEKRLKIALVQPKFDESGGAERYASNLAKGLAAQGNDVHLYGRKCNFDGQNIAFHKILSLPLSRAWKTFTFNIAARLKVKNKKFDAVQGFGKTDFQTVHRAGGGVHRAYVERARRKDLSGYDRVVVKIEDRLFRSPKLKAVICPSRWIAEEVRRFYPQVEDKIRMIPNGVDSTAFNPNYRMRNIEQTLENLSLEAGVQILLFAATNFELKGLAVAIRALEFLPGAILCVAGHDDEIPFRRIAGELDVADRVRFLGRCSNMADLYRSADVLVHPTKWDIFANVCLEALACGTPVVTTVADGFADIADGEACVEVLPKNPDPKELAEAVKRLLLLGEDARKSAAALAQKNDVAAHVNAVKNLYESLGLSKEPGDPGS